MHNYLLAELPKVMHSYAMRTNKFAIKGLTRFRIRAEARNKRSDEALILCSTPPKTAKIS
jgi:hypothetical protein